MTRFGEFKINKFLTVICIVSKMPSYYAEIHEEFSKTNRIWIGYTQQEIGAIIQTSVFCVDKTCIPRPGYICYIYSSLVHKQTKGMMQ